MLELKSKDPSLKQLVSRLAELMVENGCEFDQSLRLEIRGAELSYSLKGEPAVGAELLKLEQRCMPALEDYEWALDSSGQLVYQRNASEAAEHAGLHDAIVGNLVELYNRLDKVKAFANTAPAAQFYPYKSFFNSLMSVTHEKRLLASYAQGSDAVMVEAFWQGRIFSSINTGQVHLIPLMEFFNHSIFARPFGWGDVKDNVRPLLLHYAPLPTDNAKSREVFACYEIMDNLHAFAKYGFIDKASFFVQSQPFRLEIADGLEIEVGYQSVTANQCYAHEWAPDPLYQNSLMYRARTRWHEGRLFFPYMLVPPSRHMPAFDDALRAQLRQIEIDRGGPSGTIANGDSILRVKKALLKQNLQCYKELKTSAESAGFKPGMPAAKNLAAMIKHQLGVLKDFKGAL